MRTLAVLTLTCLFVPLAGSVPAADCICPKVPMYPVDSTNWLHYSLACDKAPTGCVNRFPTSFIGPYSASPASCNNSPNSCGNCSALPGDVEMGDLCFGNPNVAPPQFSDLDNPGKIRNFLKSNSPPGADVAKYDQMVFKPSHPLWSLKPIAVSLQRNVNGAPETFYAVLWEVRRATGGPWGYIGIEISGAPPSDAKVVTPSSICNAVWTQSDGSGNVTHTPIPGLLQVHFAQQSGEPYGRVLVRLHCSTANMNAGYVPCYP